MGTWYYEEIKVIDTWNDRLVIVDSEGQSSVTISKISDAKSLISHLERFIKNKENAAEQEPMDWFEFAHKGMNK